MREASEVTISAESTRLHLILWAESRILEIFWAPVPAPGAGAPDEDLRVECDVLDKALLRITKLPQCPSPVPARGQTTLPQSHTGTGMGGLALDEIELFYLSL